MDFTKEFNLKEFIIRFIFSAIITWILSLLFFSRVALRSGELFDNNNHVLLISTIISTIVGLLVAFKKFTLWKK